jgi:hypothetical protein
VEDNPRENNQATLRYFQEGIGGAISTEVTSGEPVVPSHHGGQARVALLTSLESSSRCCIPEMCASQNAHSRLSGKHTAYVGGLWMLEPQATVGSSDLRRTLRGWVPGRGSDSH